MKERGREIKISINIFEWSVKILYSEINTIDLSLAELNKISGKLVQYEMDLLLHICREILYINLAILIETLQETIRKQRL